MSGASAALTQALDALAGAATAAGLDPVTARAEGEALAATVSERSTGAFVDWCAATGRPTSAEEFFAAAKRGNRYRVGPTPLVAGLTASGSAQAPSYAAALGDVALAGAELGDPGPRAMGNAALAAASQLTPGQGTQPVGQPVGQPVRQPVRQPVPTLSDDIASSLLGQLGVVQRKLAAISSTPLVERGRPTQGLEPVQAAPVPPVVPVEPPAPQEPEPPLRSVEELLAELDTLVGLSEVKAEIHRQAAVLRIEGLRKEAGLTSPTITRHLIFTGNPGTGKTTVARLVAGIYRALGLLSTGQLVEVDRSELVAGFLGQTAIKTAEVVTSAVGGVLFIDEAYALAGGAGDQYGNEAVDTLVKEMEDHRDDLVVIVAGYPLPMLAFIGANPGLESRFRTTIDFPDYTDTELGDIFAVMAKGAEYDVDDAVLTRLTETLGGVQRGPSFGNARHVRNVLEAAIGRHAWRLRDVEQPTLEQLRRLLVGDLGSADQTPGPADEEQP